MTKGRLWCGLVCMLALAGCSIAAPQTETLKRLLPFQSAEQKKLQAYAWSFSIAGTEYRIYPMRVEGRAVYFGNDFGIRVVWDGESLVSVEGMPGGFGRYYAGRELNAQGQEQRWYWQESLPVHRAICSPAAAWRLSEERYGWRQVCRGEVDGVSLTTTHVVEYDGKSLVREIEASAFPGGPRFVLRRLSP